MKTLLVFLAMLLVLSSFFIYVEDTNNYIKLQKSLKALAEECAAGAALFPDSTSTKDKYVVNTDAAEAYVQFIVSNYSTTLVCFSSDNGAVSVTTASFINDSGNTCTRAVCSWNPKNGYKLFRFSFLNFPEKISQTSVYEIKKNEYIN